ncbi:unnamed protein product [Musa hybrid cultivar]
MAIFSGRKRRIGERVNQISSNEETGKRKETEGENQGFGDRIELSSQSLPSIARFRLSFTIFPLIWVFDAALFCSLLLPPERLGAR